MVLFVIFVFFVIARFDIKSELRMLLPNPGFLTFLQNRKKPPMCFQQATAIVPSLPDSHSDALLITGKFQVCKLIIILHGHV